MIPEISYIVRFYKDDDPVEEYYYNTEGDAYAHAYLFTEEDGYSAIEIARLDWYMHQETEIETLVFEG